MRIVTWNINGIRATREPIENILNSFKADIICIQETKVTRDQLDEAIAIVDGYNSYFSFSRVRSGYSGVATYCRNVTASPTHAEEGLTGRLARRADERLVGAYGNLDAFSDDELDSLDAEGRAVLTQHKIKVGDNVEDVVVINVYCPRADPERENRLHFKLQFYKLLEIRVAALQSAGRHVIILGDLNTSLQPIDHCDPGEEKDFLSSPSRIWLNDFLRQRPRVDDNTSIVDTFRYFHPDRKNAFTCWCSMTNARLTNYGTRIDYVLADRELTTRHFVDTRHLVDVAGSDHCPVQSDVDVVLLPATKLPSLCAKFLPEFAGKQRKLSDFFAPKSSGGRNLASMGNQQTTLDNQNKGVTMSAPLTLKRAASVPVGAPIQPPAKRSKLVDKAKLAESSSSTGGQQVNLFALFKKKGISRNFDCSRTTQDAATPADKSTSQYQSTSAPSTPVSSHRESTPPGSVENKRCIGRDDCSIPESSPLRENNDNIQVTCVMEAIIASALDGRDAKTGVRAANSIRQYLPESDPLYLADLSSLDAGNDRKQPLDLTTESASDRGAAAVASSSSTRSQNAWKDVLKGPPAPPMCRGHREPCVLRTVKKDNLNKGRQFWVCPRPEGHASNKEARCNHFEWIAKKTAKKS
ncbi:DNA-(apurinic or apyrimidinic site) endonuclease 2-like [Tubulanus polymorphus]|uniref:DNA-(apurinic or apyrimidinic site) endonuclease 2-like n=1 Tax=Tubulanus polymorphus TaxID=672921 RepID=UPI003DA20972